MTKRNARAQVAPEGPARTAPAGESKTDRFKRIGVPRVRRVLEAMKRLHNITNRATYDYTDEDAQKIIDALMDGVNKLHTAFQGKKVTTHFEL